MNSVFLPGKVLFVGFSDDFPSSNDNKQQSGKYKNKHNGFPMSP